MQIRQLQVANDSVQDRLVVRISSQSNEEIRVWITRRFLNTVWPHFAGRLQTLQSSATPASNADPLEEGSFEQPFLEENPTYPLGSTPLLASELSFDNLPDGTLRLTFREARERSFQFNLDSNLLRVFCAMLRASADKAEWSLSLDYQSAPASGHATPPTGSRLH